jgi:hypothetical protein
MISNAAANFRLSPPLSKTATCSKSCLLYLKTKLNHLHSYNNENIRIRVRSELKENIEANHQPLTSCDHMTISTDHYNPITDGIILDTKAGQKHARNDEPKLPWTMLQ